MAAAAQSQSQSQVGAREQASRVAQRLAAEFSIAQAGGSDLSKIRGVRTAVEELRKGVRGRGDYASLTFRVGGVTGEVAEHAKKFLTYDRNILRYHPPVDYAAAWADGWSYKSLTPSNTAAPLSQRLALQTAENLARVYGFARAGSANLTEAEDVESAMRLLEEGVTGNGPHAETEFKVPEVGPKVRFLVKKRLFFHQGHLHFIPDGTRRSKEAIDRIIARDLPAVLAQQVVALFNYARSAGVEFGEVSTPNQIITLLRAGVNSSDELGMQKFQILSDAPGGVWRVVPAYLRLLDGTLEYAPPEEH